ncbi:dipeptide epimerase, partial [Candidatus Bathyarchaeota archaeon]
RLEVAFVEQPVPAGDLPGLARVRWASPMPVMADEAVLGPGDALKVIQAEAVDLINVKLMKCGGISEALRLAAIAETTGVGLMVGCGGESRLAITAGTHLAAALKAFQHADLDSDLLLAEDLVAEGGSQVKRDTRLLPGGPGLGVRELREERLELVASFGDR